MNLLIILIIGVPAGLVPWLQAEKNQTIEKTLMNHKIRNSLPRIQKCVLGRGGLQQKERRLDRRRRGGAREEEEIIWFWSRRICDSSEEGRAVSQICTD